MCMGLSVMGCLFMSALFLHEYINVAVFFFSRTFVLSGLEMITTMQLCKYMLHSIISTRDYSI
jgi:hypothetical protein